MNEPWQSFLTAHRALVSQDTDDRDVEDARQYLEAAITSFVKAHDDWEQQYNPRDIPLEIMALIDMGFAYSHTTECKREIFWLVDGVENHLQQYQKSMHPDSWHWDC